MSQAAHPEPAHGDPPHDAAGCPYDDHDPDAHPHGDARATNGTRRQEQERIVVARLCAAGEPRRDGEQPVAAGRQHEPPRAHGEPAGRRAGIAPPGDLWAPAEVEREAGAGDVDHDCPRAGVRDSNGGTIRAGERDVRGRRGERERGSRRAGARARRGGHERQSDRYERDPAPHRPITVNVTVVV